jgi:ubiquinone/menaquinone biosynthesis C-methylase UbiE
MDYQLAFHNRAERYDYAIHTYEDALSEEFKTAVQMLDPKPNDVVVNIPAGGTPIHKYISDTLNVTVKSFEMLREHKQDNVTYCDITSIPLQDNSVDKIISLASFHHFQEDRQEVLMELRRILKNSGVLVIGDVIEGSPQDTWLNVFVNKYNSNGHTGWFLRPDSTSKIEQLGFKVESSKQTYHWSFSKDEDAIDFVKNLFGLDMIPNDAFLLDSMKQYLHYDSNMFEWQLLYLKCMKV